MHPTLEVTEESANFLRADFIAEGTFAYRIRIFNTAEIVYSRDIDEQSDPTLRIPDDLQFDLVDRGDILNLTLESSAGSLSSDRYLIEVLSVSAGRVYVTRACSGCELLPVF